MKTEHCKAGSPNEKFMKENCKKTCEFCCGDSSGFQGILDELFKNELWTLYIYSGRCMCQSENSPHLCRWKTVWKIYEGSLQEDMWKVWWVIITPIFHMILNKFEEFYFQKNILHVFNLN